MVRRRFTKSAFTLIELLVVIAIIALLAAILFPVFSRARDNARRSTCMANLKQVGLGMAQYVQDNDQRFPPIFQTGAIGTPPDGHLFFGPGWMSWQQIIYPYVKNHQLFYCPSSPSRKGAHIPSDPRDDEESRLLNANYSYNAHLGPEGGGGPVESAIPDAAGTYLFTEFGLYYFAQSFLQASSMVDSSYLPGSGSAACPMTSLPEFRNDCIFGRHFGGITVAYADGHVKWHPTTAVRAEGFKANGAWNPRVTH